MSMSLKEADALTGNWSTNVTRTAGTVDLPVRGTKELLDFQLISFRIPMPPCLPSLHLLNFLGVGGSYQVSAKRSVEYTEARKHKLIAAQLEPGLYFHGVGRCLFLIGS